MHFGVNYTPTVGWFHAWLHPDWDSIGRDLDDIARLGVDHIRIFPLWPVLQPNRSMISGSALENLRQMAVEANSRSLGVYVDILQGHLSSFDFLPSWMVTWHQRNMFTDAEAVDAEMRLVREVYSALEDLPGFLGLTLGNECNQFAEAHHPSAMPADPGQIDHWIDALLKPVREPARKSGRHLVHCENDAVWYEDGHCFTPAQAARKGDITAIHSWVFNGTAQQYGQGSDACLRHAEYLVELARAFAKTADRPIWLQEIGAPGNVIDPERAADFCRETIRHALDCRGLYGITWWCSHDVDAGLADFPPFEHSLGLYDSERRLKPIGRVFASLAQQAPAASAAQRRTTALVIPCDEHDVPVMRGALAPGGSLFEAWMRLSSRGLRPAFVTSGDAASQAALHERGISKCVQVPLTSGGEYGAVSDPRLLHAREAGH